MSFPLRHKTSSRYDRNWISKAARHRIYRRDGYRCVYCDSSYMLQLDHVKPRSRGGTDDPSNLVTACRSCNMAKGARIIPGRTVGMKVANYRKERMRLAGTTRRGGKRRNRANTVRVSQKGHGNWVVVGLFLAFIVLATYA